MRSDLRATKCRSGVTAAGVLACLAATVTLADDSPRAWLEKMSRAVDTLNYTGTLLHMHGKDADVLSVVHRVENGNVTERITAQDDVGREMIRSDAQVQWIFPDRQSILVEKRGGRAGGLPRLGGRLPDYSGIGDAYYNVAFADGARVAGRDTQGIAIRPKDSYRYGYRLWLDRATAMPLKTEVLSEEGEIVERLSFTNVSLPARIPKSAVQPSRLMNSFARRSWDAARKHEESASDSGWTVTKLPPGFHLTAQNAEASSGSEAGLRHLVYSDGLATISVFIDVAVAAAEQAEGLSQVGAANAYTTTTQGRLVTAMGEVPARTVEQIALSVRADAARTDADRSEAGRTETGRTAAGRVPSKKRP
jgi:sigma-E factor negative regulatory protein RseB